MNESDKIQYIKYRFAKAEETLLAAKQLSESGFWNSCVNRLYYACFYAVSALLVKDDMISKSHSGIKTQFFQNYIKSKKLDLEYGKLYSDLFDWRQKGDYNDFFDMQQEDVLALIEPVEDFVHSIQNLLL